MTVELIGRFLTNRIDRSISTLDFSLFLYLLHAMERDNVPSTIKIFISPPLRRVEDLIDLDAIYRVVSRLFGPFVL